MGLFAEFKKFALRGNLVDLAIGFTVGVAFSTVARSMVDDLIMPPLGLLLGQTDFSDAFLVLRAGEVASPPYTTLEIARAAGATTLNYGRFITNVLTLVLIAVAMFVVVRTINRIGERVRDEFGAADEPVTPSEPQTKKCAYCRQVVPIRASRCHHCTSFLGTIGGPLAPDPDITPEPTE
jgi:large conductance mechanosensitive channel